MDNSSICLKDVRIANGEWVKSIDYAETGFHIRPQQRSMAPRITTLYQCI